MKRTTKILLVTTALLTASGVAVAGFGKHGNNCDNPGMQGYGPDKMHQMRGYSGRGAIYQLDNLTDEQKQQISKLRKQHQMNRISQREEMMQQHAEMKKQIDAILTEDQREQLSQLRPNH